MRYVMSHVREKSDVSGSKLLKASEILMKFPFYPIYCST